MINRVTHSRALNEDFLKKIIKTVQLVCPAFSDCLLRSLEVFKSILDLELKSRASQAERTIGLPHAQHHRRYGAQQPVYAMLANLIQENLQ